MVFLQNYFNSVLELPLPRNAQKRTGNWKKKQEKKVKEKKVGWWVGGSGI
jgi:hypothetical protein